MDGKIGGGLGGGGQGGNEPNRKKGVPGATREFSERGATKDDLAKKRNYWQRKIESGVQNGREVGVIFRSVGCSWCEVKFEGQELAVLLSGRLQSWPGGNENVVGKMEKERKA